MSELEKIRILPLLPLKINITFFVGPRIHRHGQRDHCQCKDADDPSAIALCISLHYGKVSSKSNSRTRSLPLPWGWTRFIPPSRTRDFFLVPGPLNSSPIEAMPLGLTESVQTTRHRCSRRHTTPFRTNSRPYSAPGRPGDGPRSNPQIGSPNSQATAPNSKASA